MKRALILLPVLIVLALVALIVAPGFVDWNRYKAQAQEHVRTISGLDLELGGDISFALLPFPHLSARDVALKSPAGGQNGAILSFDELDVSVALMPLLDGEVQVQTVTLVKPLMNIEVLENGKLAFMTPEIDKLMVEGEGAGKPGATTPAVSFDTIRIKDGVFSYRDEKSKTEIAVQNINADIRAETLRGPYAAEGSLYYAGRSMNFNIQSGAFDPEAKTLSPKVKLSLQPDDIEVDYAGALNFGEKAGAQGQFGLSGRNLEKTLEAYNLRGTGAGSVPFSLKGFLSADSEKATLTDMAVELGQAKLGGTFGLSFAPLKYDISLKSDQPFDIREIYGAMPLFRSGAVNLAASGDGKTFSLSKSGLNLDGTDFTVSGTYRTQGASGRPALAVDIEAARLDYDALMKKMPQAQDSGGEGLEDSLRKMVLPLDVNLSFLIQNLKYQSQDVKNVAGVLAWQGESFKIEKLSALNYMGADISATGRIGNLRALSGVNLNLSVDSSDPKTLLEAYGVDTASWPQTMGKAAVKAKLEGSAEQMEVIANISALKGEVIAQGALKTPLRGASLGGLAVQVKHPDMAQAIALYTGASVQDRNLSGPLDFYCRVNQVGKSYKLEDIKGSLAGTSVQGSAILDFAQSKPAVSGNLKFGKIVLNTIVNKSGASTQHSGERWSKEPLSTQGLQAVNVDLSLSATSIDYGPWPLQAPQMKLTLRDGVVTIPELSAGLFDGRVSMSSVLSAAPQPRQPLHIEGKAALADVDAGKLVKALSGTQLVRVSGRVSLNTELATSGISPAALVYDLGGKGTVTGQNIVLDGVDVTRFARALSDESKPGDTVLHLWKGSAGGGHTSFDTLDGAFTINAGVVTIQKLDLDGVQASIATTGTVDLPRWTLATKHKITVKERTDVPAFEVSFNGPIDNPAQTFGQGLLQDYLNRKISRKFEKLLTDKLGLPGQGSNTPQTTEPADGSQQQEPAPQQQDQPEEIKPEEAIEGLIKGLLR